MQDVVQVDKRPVKPQQTGFRERLYSTCPAEETGAVTKVLQEGCYYEATPAWHDMMGLGGLDVDGCGGCWQWVHTKYDEYARRCTRTFKARQDKADDKPEK